VGTEKIHLEVKDSSGLNSFVFDGYIVGKRILGNGYAKRRRETPKAFRGVDLVTSARGKYRLQRRILCM
jgi:hypothetical protein